MKYTYGQLRAFAVAAGFPGASADIAAAIALAESGGESNATNIVTQAQADAWNAEHPEGPRHGPERSFGPWQVNTLVHPAFSEQHLTDPAYNAKAAFAVSNGGTNFAPWSTFTDGTYKRYLQSGASDDLDALILAALVALLAVAAKRGIKVPA